MAVDELDNQAQGELPRPQYGCEMSACPHCHGTGRKERGNREPYQTTRVPDLRRMIPHGNDVMAALRAGTPLPDVHLYCGTCPTSHKDAWALAGARIAKFGPGTAMVLPEGSDPASFRYPPLDIGPMGVSVAVFAYGLSTERQHTIGHALIADGMQRVAVLGGLSPDGPMGAPGGPPLIFEAQ